MTRQDQILCRYCGNRIGSEGHHLFKRSTSPELADDPKNLVKLCFKCHARTEDDHDFLVALQEIFFNWNPANLDIFLRAQASIDDLLNGKCIEYLTPQMTDNYLTLAGASYAYYSEQLATLEKLEALFFVSQEGTNSKIQMLWNATTDGQKMIDYKRKLKSLEKTMSNLRTRLNRFKYE